MCCFQKTSWPPSSPRSWGPFRMGRLMMSLNPWAVSNISSTSARVRPRMPNKVMLREVSHGLMLDSSIQPDLSPVMLRPKHTAHAGCPSCRHCAPRIWPQWAIHAGTCGRSKQPVHSFWTAMRQQSIHGCSDGTTCKQDIVDDHHLQVLLQ